MFHLLQDSYNANEKAKKPEISWLHIHMKSQLKPLKIDFGPVLGHPTTTSRSVVVCLFAPVSRVNKESIPPVYVTLRAGTKTLFLLGSKPP